MPTDVTSTKISDISEDANQTVAKEAGSLHEVLLAHTSDNIITFAALLGKDGPITTTDQRTIRERLSKASRSLEEEGLRVGIVRNRHETGNYGVYVETLVDNPHQITMIGNVLRVTDESGVTKDSTLDPDQRRVMNDLAMLRSGSTYTTHKFQDETALPRGERTLNEVLMSLDAPLVALTGTEGMIAAGGNEQFGRFRYIRGATITRPRDNYNYYPVHPSRLEALTMLFDDGRDVLVQELIEVLGKTRGRKSEQRDLRPREAHDALQHALTNLENRTRKGIDIATDEEKAVHDKMQEFLTTNQLPGTEDLMTRIRQKLYPQPPVATQTEIATQPPPFGTLEHADIAIIAIAMSRYKDRLNPLLERNGLTIITDDILEDRSARFSGNLPEIPEEDREQIVPARRSQALEKVKAMLYDEEAITRIAEDDPNVGFLLIHLSEMDKVRVRSKRDRSYDKTGMDLLVDLLTDPEADKNGFYVVTPEQKIIPPAEVVVVAFPRSAELSEEAERVTDDLETGAQPIQAEMSDGEQPTKTKKEIVTAKRRSKMRNYFHLIHEIPRTELPLEASLGMVTRRFQRLTQSIIEPLLDEGLIPTITGNQNDHDKLTPVGIATALYLSYPDQRSRLTKQQQSKLQHDVAKWYQEWLRERAEEEKEEEEKK